MDLSRRPAHVRARWGVVLVLLLLLAALFPSVVFRGESFYERDIQFDAYTTFDSFVRSIAQHALPLWDNAIAFGQPLLAYPNSEVLYPPTWLNLLLRPGVLYPIFVLAHVLFTGLGAYVLGRTLGRSRAASLLTAGVWMASGPLLSLVNVYHIAGACWIPWLWAAAEYAFTRKTVTAASLLAVASAFQVLAGSPEMCAVGQGTVLLALARHLREATRVAGVWLGSTALALALSAAQWLPTLAITLHSPRLALPERTRTLWSVHPLGLIQALVPVRLQELRLQPAIQNLVHGDEGTFLAALYLGLSAALLAFIAVRARDRYRTGLLIVLSGTVLFALGSYTPAYGWAARILPPLRLFRYPSKILLLTAIVWAVLVGSGLDEWVSRRARPWRGPVIVGAVLVILAASILVWGPRFLAPVPGADVHRVAARIVVAMFATVAVLFVFVRRETARANVVLVGLVLADLVVAHSGLNRTTSSVVLDAKPYYVEAARPPDRQRLFAFEYLFLPRDTVRALLGRDDAYALPVLQGEDAERAAVLSLRVYPYPPSAGRWGIETSYDPDERGLYPRPLARMASFVYETTGTPAFLRLLQVGAVSRVVALHTRGLEGLPLLKTIPTLFPEALHVYEVPEPLPRTYAVGGARVVNDEAALSLLASGALDIRREVVLAPESADVVDVPAGVVGRSRIVTMAPDHVVLEADLDADGFVVLVDSHDPAWRTSVDGAPAALLRANVAFRAVRVSAGHHVIDMRYRPRSVTWGAAISLVSAAGLGVALLRRRRADR